jgi:hypothetical protein
MTKRDLGADCMYSVEFTGDDAAGSLPLQSPTMPRQSLAMPRQSRTMPRESPAMKGDCQGRRRIACIAPKIK